MTRIVVALGLLVALLTSAAGAQQTEGRFVLYVAHGAEIVEPMMELFERTHPGVQYDVIYGAGTGELMSRLQAERANPRADVMWGGSSELYEANADVFAPVELENDSAMVVQDDEHVWHATDLLLQVISVNTDLVAEEDYPSSFQDLLDPRWADTRGIVLSNPRASGTAYSLVITMVTLHDWDYVYDLMANTRLVEGSSPMFGMVRDGEAAAGFLNEDLGAQWVRAGLPLHMIYPEDGVSNQVGAAAVVAGAQHPEAAALFVNFLMSPEAQELQSSVIGRRPARADVAPPEGLAPIEGLNLVRPDPVWASQEIDQILDRFDEIRRETGR
jgi:iron(III) transport system substrate-binding protein